MQTGPHFRPAVLAAKEQLASERAKLHRQHDSGSPGIQVCAHLADLIDTVVLDLYHSVLDEIGERDEDGLQREIALVAHGGYGRRDIAPYSDVDLMLLYKRGAEQRVAPLARQLAQNIYDVGLQLGFSVRTPAQACGLALQDATIFTSLVESRYMGGSASLFSSFMSKFRRNATWRAGRLITALRIARREERGKYGSTVYLLKPNVKRSRGGLRDIQMLRWVGFARYGQNEPRNLYHAGVLSRDDRTKIRESREFLLRLRNELHFYAARAQDVLERPEQIRLAKEYGFEGREGTLPVEEFMREYFERTSDVRYIVSHFVAGAQNRSTLKKIFGPIVGHQVEDKFRVGPFHINATPTGLATVCGDLRHILRLMELANWYDKRIAHETWQAIRDSMVNHDEIALSAEATERFLSLMSQPAQLGEMLRRLHQLRMLEKIIPAVKHARCLVQFNEYHKYTVDEHSIRAVEHATGLIDDDGPLGEAYRSIKQKRTLHLALLLHDLGKGFPEDHSEVGQRLAGETARHLGLGERETETLKFLVHKHLLMNHLAFRRDLDDESVIVQFAVEVGSPNVLKMLYVLSCADLSAVGPGVLNQWKLNLLTQLYRRTMRHLAGEGPTRGSNEWLERRRGEIRSLLTADQRDTWWETHISKLPVGYLASNSPQQVIEEVGQLRKLSAHDAVAWGRFRQDRNAVEYTVGTHENIAPGVFHRMTGALTSKGHQILAAEINTLPDGLVLDRFYVNDLDFAGEPPPERLEEVSDALTAALKNPSDQPPTFRRVWRTAESESTEEITPLPTRVHVDNDTSENYSIIDVFARDRIGLLYTITRTLFELDLSVSVAKIGTYLDQVVDVFYVTDQRGNKIEDERRISEIRERLLNRIEQIEPMSQAVGKT